MMKRIICVFLLSTCTMLMVCSQVTDWSNSDLRDRQLTQQIIEEMESVNTSLPQINLLRKQGEKSQAKMLIEKTIDQLENIETERKLLGQIDEYEYAEVPSLAQIRKTKQDLINIATKLQYSFVSVNCETNIFGDECASFCGDVISNISNNDNVSFVDSPDAAEWEITITVKTREHTKQEFGGMTTYFAYADAQLVIQKCASRKVVCKKQLSEKGGDFIDYKHAAQEACKYLVPKLSDIIKEQIMQ